MMSNGKLPTGLDLLRSDSGGDSHETDIDILQRALEADRQALETTSEYRGLFEPEQQERRLEKLVEELERCGKVDSPKFLAWWRPVLAIAIAGILALGIFLPLQVTVPPLVYDEPPGWRGPLTIVPRYSANPRGDAEKMRDGLQVVGLTAKVYQRDRVFFIDLLQEEPLTPEQAGYLLNLGLDPTSKAIRVEFDPRK